MMSLLPRRLRLYLVMLSGMLGVASSAHGAPPEYEIEIRNHLFHPDVITIPSDTKIKLIVYNRDPTPEEFESFELNREKVILGGARAIIFIGPLPPGEYPFFGEFNPTTALGKIIVEGGANAGQ